MEMVSRTSNPRRVAGAVAIVFIVCAAPLLCAQAPPGALVVSDGVGVGGVLVVDSFDSADPAFSNGGRYDSTKFRANGDIRCSSLLSLHGNTVILGRLW